MKLPSVGLSVKNFTKENFSTFQPQQIHFFKNETLKQINSYILMNFNKQGKRRTKNLNLKQIQKIQLNLFLHIKKKLFKLFHLFKS